MFKRFLQWLDPVPKEHETLRSEFDLQTASELLDVVVPLGRVAGIAYVGAAFMDVLFYPRILSTLLLLRLALCVPFFLLWVLKHWRTDARAVFRGLFFFVILGSIPVGFMFIVTSDPTGPYAFYFMLIIMFMGTLPWPAGWVLPANLMLLAIYIAGEMAGGAAHIMSLFLTYVYYLLGCLIGVLFMQRELMRLRWVNFFHQRQVRGLNLQLAADLETQKQLSVDLAAAREAADEANRAKSTFLATMSHEIRTPLNAIIGMSGLLMDTELSPDQRECADVIRGSGDALLAVISDILDFSKIEAGRMDLEEQPFGLRECLESALELVTAPAAARGIELGLFVDPSIPPTVRGDVTRLRQILINLLGNAIKFTDRGEVVLKVDVGLCTNLSSQETQYLRFSVRDTGIGFRQDRREILFQSFSQADTSTTRRFGGTGLGLAISRRLVELMGGTIQAESEGQGKGSTFSFSVPLRNDTTLTRNPLLHSPHRNFFGRRIMVCESSALQGQMLAAILESWDIHVCTTHSAADATLQVHREAFDAAIIDLSMRTGSGDLLASAVSRPAGQRNLPLIGIVPLGQHGTGPGHEPVTAVVARPVRSSQLFDTLIRIFSTDRSEGTTGQPSPPSPVLDARTAVQHPLRLLLAEDNLTNQKIAQRLLLQLGYRADVAANGLEVLDALGRQQYDVVFMDVQMPELDGLQATRLIRQKWPSGGPRIIAMTADALSGDREKCLGAGMDDYLSKPLRTAELVEKIRACHSGGQTPLPTEAGAP